MAAQNCIIAYCADRGVQARFSFGCDVRATLIYKSNWRITTAIVIFQQRHRARFRARGISSKNTQISIPKAAGSALSTPRTYGPFSRSVSLPLSLSICLSRASFARRKRSNSPVSRDRPCTRVYMYSRACVRASGYAYKSGLPAREMYSEAEVASTYRRTSSSSFSPRRYSVRVASFPRFPPLFSSTFSRRLFRSFSLALPPAPRALVCLCAQKCRRQTSASEKINGASRRASERFKESHRTNDEKFRASLLHCS